MLPSGPKSVLAITRTLKSFCTLPMISTAWLSWRCESCKAECGVSIRSLVKGRPFNSSFFARTCDQGVKVATYAVQEDADLAACVDSRLFAAQLADFAEDADGLVGELLEVGSGDAGGCFGHCGCVCCMLLQSVQYCDVFLLVEVVVHAWEATRGKTCRVESLRVGLGAKAREWRMNIG